MTLAALPRLVEYIGQPTAITVPVPFQFFGVDELRVERRDAAGVQAPFPTSSYTIDGGDGGEGAVAFIGSTAGVTIVIAGATAIDQPDEYPAGGRFPTATVERGFDRRAAVDREQQDQLEDTRNRALLLPNGEATGTLPAANDRSGKLLGFDLLTGTPMAVDSDYLRGADGLPGAPAASSGPIRATQGQTEFSAGFVFDPGVVQVTVNGFEIAATDFAVNASNDGIVIIGGGLNAGDVVNIRSFVVGAPVSLSLSPRMFGARADGVTDDSAAWQRMATAAINATTVIDLGTERYRITQPITFASTVTMRGAEAQLTFDGATAQLRFTINNDNSYTGRTLDISGISFRAKGARGSLIYARQTGATEYGTPRQFTMYDCDFNGVGPTDSYDWAVELVNLAYPTFYNCRIDGDEAHQPRLSGGIRIHAEPGYDKGDALIDRCTFFFLRTSIKMTGHQEGNKVTQCTFVSCLDGLDWQADADAAEPLLYCAGNHFNCERNSIVLRRVIQFDIVHNVFYAQGGDGIATEAHAVDVQAGNTSYLQGLISGNKFYGAGRFAPFGLAVFLQGTSDPIAVDAIVDHNHFQGWTHAIYLDGQTTQARIGLNNVFAGNTHDLTSANPNNAINGSDSRGFMGFGRTDPEHRVDVAGSVRAANGFVYLTGAVTFSGSAPPEGAIAARPGSQYLQAPTDTAQPGALWFKKTGSGTTGWVAVA